MCLPKTYVETLTLNDTVFVEKAFKEIMLNEVIRAGPYSNKKGAHMRRQAPGMHAHRGRAM